MALAQLRWRATSTLFFLTTSYTMLLTCSMAVVAAAFATATNTAAQTLLRSDGVVVSSTNPTYASWTIDSSYNRGFVHTHFDNPNLLAAATSLSPSTLRFGGGGNDYLHYGPPSMPCKSNNDSDSSVCLNMTHWNNLFEFVNSSGSFRCIFIHIYPSPSLPLLTCKV